jgi:hypothetical protein
VNRVGRPRAVPVAGALDEGSLLDLNFEERVVGVFMAPLEVLLLLAPLHLIEVPVVSLLLLEIGAVSTIFVVVPRMVVAGISIVIAFFVMVAVVSSSGDRANQSGAHHQCAQNQKPMHVVILAGIIRNLRTARPRAGQSVPSKDLAAKLPQKSRHMEPEAQGTWLIRRNPLCYPVIHNRHKRQPLQQHSLPNDRFLEPSSESQRSSNSKHLLQTILPLFPAYGLTAFGQLTAYR